MNDSHIHTTHRGAGDTVSSHSRSFLSHLKPYRAFLVVVVLPTLVASVYLLGVAADQYVSEARFTVRQGTESGNTSSLLGAVFGSSASSLAQGESYAVADYLTSHDAVKALQQKVDLASIFRRPEADPLMRLWWRKPSAEDMLDYYQRQVSVTFDTQTGLAILRVRAFRPEDAYAIANILLDLGEKRVNDLSTVSQLDTLRVIKDAVTRAEARVTAAQLAITNFRLKQQALDPSKSATTLFTVLGGLEGQLAAAKAQLQSQSAYLGPDSPEYLLEEDRIRALQDQITSETARMSGDGKQSLAPIVSAYERLQLEEDFADKEYTVQLATLESAQIEVMKQHLFVARVVEPNLPEDSTYPKRLTFIATLFASLSLMYSIGWLMYAGVKEHTA